MHKIILKLHLLHLYSRPLRADSLALSGSASQNAHIHFAQGRSSQYLSLPWRLTAPWSGLESSKLGDKDRFKVLTSNWNTTKVILSVLDAFQVSWILISQIRCRSLQQPNDFISAGIAWCHSFFFFFMSVYIWANKYLCTHSFWAIWTTWLSGKSPYKVDHHTVGIIVKIASF